MQITIDSNEPLDRVLPVINAVYNVSLSLPDITTSEETTPARARRTRTSTATSRKPAARRNKRPTVTPGTVRQWARTNGYAVSSHGRLPAELLEAYQAAN